MQNSNVYSLFGDDGGHSLDDQLALLAEVVQSFASSLNVDETLSNAIQKFIQYLSAEAASIFLLSDDRRELVCRACAGPVDITGLRLPTTPALYPPIPSASITRPAERSHKVLSSLCGRRFPTSDTSTISILSERFISAPAL